MDGKNKFKGLPSQYNTAAPFSLDPNYDPRPAMKTMMQLNPITGIPFNAQDLYSGIKNRDYLQAGIGGLGLLGTGILGAPSAATGYAKATMPLRNAQVNIEATSPTILQGANNSRQGQFLSDMRYDIARQGAANKGMSMANSPVSKTQGVWVDPASNVEEFNRVYAQNIGRLPKGSIQDNPALSQYANSMGGDLGQWGVGAARFSPLPFNINKAAANAVLYPKASSKDIIEAGKRLNPKGGVVSSTPQGGMLVFDTGGTMTAKDLAKSIKGASSKPKYGLLDSAYFDTSAQPQGAYMSNVDNLIKGLGY
jgi:hypothetical protein